MFNSTIIIFDGSITICCRLNPPSLETVLFPHQVTARFGQGQLKDQIIVEAWRHIVLPWKLRQNSCKIRPPFTKLRSCRSLGRGLW